MGFENIHKQICLKKVVIALICGWISLILAKKSILVDHVYDTRFVWQILFPILIATAWEPIYAYITGIGGLVFLFPFLEMPSRGWANLLIGGMYLILLIMCGHLFKGGREDKKYYVVYVIYMILYYLVLTCFYGMFLLKNPNTLPFCQYVSPMILRVQTITSALSILAVATFVKVLLSLSDIRRILKMEPLDYSEKNMLIFFVTFLTMICYFMVDQLFEKFYFDTRGLHTSLLTGSLGTIIKLPVVFAMACMVCDAIIFNTMKNLESKKKVEQLNADLEQMVEDRTQELHMAYKELESFSYTVIHELKTPIREMDTYLEIIEEDNIEVLADQSKTDIASARNVCTQTLDMIEKMMVYTKAGFVVLDLEKIDMTRLVQDCFDDIQKVNKPKRIVLKLEKLPPIYADAFLIRVAIMNILSNSIKFSQTREVIILSVYVTQYEEQTVYYFTDNGVGFDSDLDNNVLELFTRAHNNSEYEGSGIGLALVKRIINRHGGSVKIQGKEGEGCIVSLIFHNNVK